MSNEKNPGCLGDYTAQLYVDYHKPFYGPLLNNQYNGKQQEFLFVAQLIADKLDMFGSADSLHLANPKFLNILVWGQHNHESWPEPA